ncbi:MAG: minor capsid protein [Lachnospiraceae bacterium]|nr:minor capsid protein [Lachnospiraceae bacterium]
MISGNLLVHTVTLKKPTGFDRDRNETYEEYAIEKVRVEADIGRTRGSEGETPNDTATLYVDAHNTRYETADGAETAAVLPEENDKVEWQGRSFTVRSVTPCYAQSEAPNHWEVTLE